MKTSFKAGCVVLWMIVACGGTSANVNGLPQSDGDDSGTIGSSDGGTDEDAARSTPEPDGGDASVCAEALSSTLSGTYGRLDGIVTALVLPGSTACHGDPTHLHLQVEVASNIYDVAVPVTFTDAGNQIGIDEKDEPTLAGSAWTEGWHGTGVTLDYVSSFDVHQSDFSLVSAAVATSRMRGLMSVGDEVSIWGHVYASLDGLNAIFRDDGVSDGAIAVVHPSTSVHYILLSKSTQTF